MKYTLLLLIASLTSCTVGLQADGSKYASVDPAVVPAVAKVLADK
jgi:hypothetical protein